MEDETAETFVMYIKVALETVTGFVAVGLQITQPGQLEAPTGAEEDGGRGSRLPKATEESMSKASCLFSQNGAS